MRRDTLAICALTLPVLLTGACVDKGPGATQKEIDPAYIEKHLLTETPPKLTNAVNADFGGKVVYLGNDVESDTIVAGEPAKIVHYWKIVDSPGSDWRVFTHVLANTQNDEWMNLDYTDMRHGYGPAKWQAGDIVRDEQEFRLKKDWKSPYAKVLVGLYRKGGQTVSDRMPVVTGPVDKDSAVLAIQFKVTRSKPKPPRGNQVDYVIKRAAAPIAIDGKADEDDWKRARSSPRFAVAEGSPTLKGDTTGRMLWDDQYLYLFVSSRDTDVYSEYKNHDDPLWKQDVVEMFIDADRNRRGYVELQINPNNTQFDSWFATTRAGKAEPGWNAGMKSAVVVHGTADNRDDTDTGWDVEVAIPLAAVKGQDQAMRVTLPPKPGQTWRLNVVRVDQPKGQKNQSVASWNQITYQDFHALSRMLNVQFGDETGNTKPAAKPAPTPPTGTPDPAKDPAKAGDKAGTAGDKAGTAGDKAGTAGDKAGTAGDKASKPKPGKPKPGKPKPGKPKQSDKDLWPGKPPAPTM